MKILKRIIFSITILATAFSLDAQKTEADYVNPFIGTANMGHTFPGVCLPFGMVQLSPDTDTIPHSIDGVYQKDTYKYCAGYQYSDSSIVGFSHTHMSGTGHSDLGDVLLMPTIGKLFLNPGTSAEPDLGYRSRFSHSSEKATAGYYEVKLKDYGINVQLTSTQRVGIHKYSFPDCEQERHLIIDLNHGIYNYSGKTLWSSIRVENDTLLTGFRITNGWSKFNCIYFAISLSQPIIEYGYKDCINNPYKGFWKRFNIYKNFPEMSGRSIVSYFNFSPKGDKDLLVKVALSSVSTAGALQNLYAEGENLDFEEFHSRAIKSWDKMLGKFEIKGSESQKQMFYTSLYHTLINPSIYMDVDGKYRGIDNNIHEAKDFNNYSIFSLWDTYRAEHPFLNLFYPSYNTDMVESMIQHQKQSVHHMLPIWSHMANENWCMSGFHAVSVLSDAIVTGTYNKNVQKALDAMIQTSNVSYYDNISQYLKLGYVPFDSSKTATSTTLEYSYDDWTIYNVLHLLKKTEEAKKYYDRALFYRNIFNPVNGFACPRLSDGKFCQEFDPLQTFNEGFIEGNSWNFSFHVPHDVYGMIKCFGGEKVFLRRLDSLFTMDFPKKYYEKNEDITVDGLIGAYVHGNEPSHHIPYLYAWTLQPWKSQYWIREILNRQYKNEINGLGGNDDCGQMSAWYMFSVMGFYPVCPGSGQYVLGAPYFEYLRVNLPNGKTLTIKAPKVSNTDRYVRSLYINGRKYDKMYVTFDQILQGGIWEYKMSRMPNRKRGVKMTDKPYSLTI